MRDRQFLPCLLAIGLLTVAACSKTQDSNPSTRLFGDPPQIQSASVNAGTATALCDFTMAFDYWFLFQGKNIQVTPGPLVLGGTYTELTMAAKVVDPNSAPPPGRNDILLVSASYVDPASNPPSETTLVLFDDGSLLSFPYNQTAPLSEICTQDASGAFSCTNAANIPMHSNDPTANDGTYTRGFAQINTNVKEATGLFPNQLFGDCVALLNHESPVTSPLGTTLSFRIDAVDREGNLTTWPTRLTVTSGASTFVCSGDDCLCCFIQNGVLGLRDKCLGLNGLVGPFAPQGFCK